MTPASLSHEITSPERRAKFLLALIAVVLYFGPAFRHSERPLPKGQFVELAEAFLRGEISFELNPGSPLRYSELIPAEGGGRFYCGYPPLPAVLLMPFVLLFGNSLTVEFATRAVSVINVLLIDACVRRLPSAIGRPPWQPPDRYLLTAFFSFGTAALSNTMIAGDWHLAHAVAFGAMSAALAEFLGPGRMSRVGACVAGAMLSRPTAALTGVFFVVLLVRKAEWRSLLKFCAAPLVALLLLCLYNYLRFKACFDFGYDRMWLDGEGRDLMIQYGQFNPAFAPRNFFWFFLAPPWPRNSAGFPWIGFDPRGLGLFFASPAFICIFPALRQRPMRNYVAAACAGVVLAIIPLLAYFNTGFWQFGTRFSLDYLPMLLVLMGIALTHRMTRLGRLLLVLSIGIHMVAIVWTPTVRIPFDLIPSLHKLS